MLLDETLPLWHHRERHARHVDAPPERVFQAIRELTVADAPLGQVLMRLRGIRADVHRPLFDEMHGIGFGVDAVARNKEIVFAAVGKPWRLRGGGARPRVDDFREFAEPGYAKMALNFAFDGDTLSTETRVLLTDEASRRAFRRYWLLIRPFSGLIRRLWLRAIERRARE